MGESSCVACGECMISCPTGALTNRSVVKIVMDKEGQIREDEQWQAIARDRQKRMQEIAAQTTAEQGAFTEPSPPTKTVAEPTADPRRAAQFLRPGPVPAHELKKLHPKLFGDISEQFLDWNYGAVVRRHFKNGEILCREGEFGSTAFIIEQGHLEVRIRSPFKRPEQPPSLLARFFGRVVPTLGAARNTNDPAHLINIDAPVALEYGNPVAVLDPSHLIFGEMTCMSNYPRSATVTAQGDCTVLEVLRNVVYMLQRTRSSREILRDVYRDRALTSHLRQVELFSQIFKTDDQFQEFVNRIRPRVDLIRAYPKMLIFREGQPADAFYLVRTGFVKVARKDLVLNYIGPGGYFGEIGLLSDLDELRGRAPPGVRTATCTALDHVDLVRIRGEDFKALMSDHPELREHLIEIAHRRLEENARIAEDVYSPGLGPFVDQGLYNAQSLLVLDLEKCTRCDECARTAPMRTAASRASSARASASTSIWSPAPAAPVTIHSVWSAALSARSAAPAPRRS